MKTNLLFAVLFLFVTAGCDVNHRIAAASGNEGADNKGNNTVTAGAFDVDAIKDLSHAVDARELLASLGVKDPAEKLDAKIDVLVSDAISHALPVTNPTLGEQIFANKNLVQAAMSVCRYGFIPVEGVMLTNDALNKINTEMLTNLSDADLDQLALKVRDTSVLTKVMGYGFLDTYSKSIQKEKLENSGDKLSALQQGIKDVKFFESFKPAFFCVFCDAVINLSDCKDNNIKIFRMCEQAKDGSLFKARIEEIDTLIKADAQASDSILKELDSALNQAIKDADKTLKDVEIACSENGGDVCKTVDALKKADSEAYKAYELFRDNSKKYALTYDEKFQAIYAEMQTLGVELARLQFPCEDPNGEQASK